MSQDLWGYGWVTAGYYDGGGGNMLRLWEERGGTDPLYHAVSNDWTLGEPIWSLYQLHDGDEDAMLEHARRNWGEDVGDGTMETYHNVHMTPSLDEARKIADMQGHHRILEIDPAKLHQNVGLGDEGYPSVSDQINPEAIRRVIPAATHTASRTAALNSDLATRLHDEFHDWYDREGSPTPTSRWNGTGDRGPLGYWPNIEDFLKSRYPAAHKGFDKGMEGAQQMLDRPRRKTRYGETPDDDEEVTPYETGPDAMAKYGYDPAEVAAGMLLLHNQTHPHRWEDHQEDLDRLTDIVTKRHQMQQQHDNPTPGLLDGYDTTKIPWHEQDMLHKNQHILDPDTLHKYLQINHPESIRTTAARLAMPMREIPQFGHQLPHVGPMPGADPSEHVDNYWVSGGCGEMALAFKNMFPDLKIGAEITKKRRGSYYDDDDEDNLEMAHVWVHDGTHSHDGFGTHVNTPDAWAGSHGGDIDLDVDPQRIADSMGVKWSPGDGQWDDPNVLDAADEIQKHWFNRHYNPDTGEHQDHPYKEARTMTAAVTVYTKPSCPQCDMTHKLLDKLGIDHDTVDLTADPEAHAYVTGLGYQQAPVVVVNDGERHWAGFSPDKLKGLVE